MWPETADKVCFEIGQLKRLIDLHQPLLAKVRETEPDAIELSALASFLHSFYNGIEIIFKRIAVEIDGTLPAGDRWHADLLSLMEQPTSKRQAAVPHDLCVELTKYMGFRHAFRNAYTFELKWRKMAELVLGCEKLLNDLEAELEAFFNPATSN